METGVTTVPFAYVHQKPEDYEFTLVCPSRLNIANLIGAPPTRGAQRLPNDQAQNGYTFEIKTGNWSIQVLLHQTRDYILAGYIPMVVNPQDINKKTLDVGMQCSVKWILEFLSASVVVPTRPDEAQFQLHEDQLKVDDPLRSFSRTRSYGRPPRVLKGFKFIWLVVCNNSVRSRTG